MLDLQRLRERLATLLVVLLLAVAILFNATHSGELVRQTRRNWVASLLVEHGLGAVVETGELIAMSVAIVGMSWYGLAAARSRLGEFLD